MPSRRTVRTLILGLSLLATALVHADDQRRLPQGAGLIGQVIDAQNGRGVDRAVVTLIGTGRQRQIVTDSRGRFLLTGLSDGEYILTATRQGFLDGAFGRRRSGGTGHTIVVNAGQWLTGLEIPIWRPAVVTGAVSDAFGEPVEGVRVQAFRRHYVGSQAVLERVASDTTDDTGSYRFSGLHAEDHVVRVDAGVRLYFPLGTRPSHAQIVTPVAGRETGGINFYLPPADDDQSLTGVVHPPPSGDASSELPPATATAHTLRVAEPPDPELLLSDEDREFTRVALDDEHRFVIERLVPRNYSLEADWPDGSFVRQEIEVSAQRPSETIAISAIPGLVVRGSVSVKRVVNVRPLPALDSMVVALIRQDGVRRETISGRTDSGTISVGPVRPGPYDVAITGLPAGWSVIAAEAEGTNVMWHPMNLGVDGLLPELRITISDQSASVSGLVRGPAGQADGEALVVVFPAGPSAAPAGQTFSARTSRFGHYAVTDLPPGSYLIAAIDDADSAGWQAPERLQQLRRGATAVTLKPGETRVFELKRLNLRRR